VGVYGVGARDKRPANEKIGREILRNTDHIKELFEGTKVAAGRKRHGAMQRFNERVQKIAPHIVGRRGCNKELPRRCRNQFKGMAKSTRGRSLKSAKKSLQGHGTTSQQKKKGNLGSTSGEKVS